MILAQQDPQSGAPFLIFVIGCVCLYFGLKRLFKRKTWGWILSGLGALLTIGVAVYVYGPTAVAQWFGDVLTNIGIFIDSVLRAIF